MNTNKQENTEKKSKKTGPKGKYAIKKIMNRLTDKEKSNLRRKFYLEHMPKYKIGIEVSLSHQLVSDLINELGPLTANDLILKDDI
jgi:hypothetical protein